MNNFYEYQKPQKPSTGWAVDCGSVNGQNPGLFEYRIVNIKDNTIILNHTIQGTTTNNIAEFLAIAHALILQQQQKHKSFPIYSDSNTALSWTRRKDIKTTFKVDNFDQLNQIHDAITFLNSKAKFHQPFFWSTKLFGNIPADYGRK